MLLLLVLLVLVGGEVERWLERDDTAMLPCTASSQCGPFHSVKVRT